jgi:hypothetical protein
MQKQKPASRADRKKTEVHDDHVRQIAEGLAQVRGDKRSIMSE